MSRSLSAQVPNAVPLGEPIDFAALNRQLVIDRTNPEYQYKESTGEYVARRQKEIDSALQRKQEYADQTAERALQMQREQAQREALRNSIKGQPTSPEVATPQRESPLSQPQRPASERQYAPSAGNPPPTINNTAARASALVEPTATPRPAALMEAIPSVAAGAAGTLGAAAQSIPRSLPQAAGRLAVPGVFVAADFASRVVQGQSVAQAAGSALIVGGTSFAGGLIGTAFGGPIGGAVGNVVGGFIGSKVSDFLFGNGLPSNASRQESIAPSYSPYIGGQVAGARYNVSFTFDLFQNGNFSSTQTSGFNGMWGPITSIALENPAPETGGVGLVVVDNPPGLPNSRNRYTFGFYPTWTARNLRNVSVVNTNGTKEFISPSSPTPPTDNIPTQYSPSPLGNDNTVPSGTPSAGQNKGKTREIAPSMPANNRPNGAPFFPGHAGLAPSYLPNPSQMPSNGGGMLPDYGRIPDPRPFAEPEDYAVPRAIGSGTSSFYTDLGRTPTPVSEPVKAIPIGDGLTPFPKSQSQPIPKTTEQTEKEKDSQKIKDLNDEVTKLGTAIAAITALVNKIPADIARSPDVQAANRETTQGAVCEIAQPGGCLRDALDNSANQVNNNTNNRTGDILGALNAAENTAQIGLLNTILERLGAQVPGGIGGKLSRLADWLHLDRVLNIFILATTIHNGLMLSNDIEQTLLGAINNLLTLVGLKKEDGSSFDLGSVISSSVENLIKGAIGADNYTELTAAWARANRIYQATTNILNAFQGLASAILTGLEMTAGKVAKIGNALRKAGEVLESAYGWMNPQPKFNRVTQTLESLQNGASTIQMVTQAPLDVINAVTELTNANTEFVKAIKEDDKPENKGKESPEPDKIKADIAAAKSVSAAINFDVDDLFNNNQ